MATKVKGWKLTFPSILRYERPSTLGKHDDAQYSFVFPCSLKLTISDSLSCHVKSVRSISHPSLGKKGVEITLVIE